MPDLIFPAQPDGLSLFALVGLNQQASRRCAGLQQPRDALLEALAE
jgi:hypothetical protein